MSFPNDRPQRLRRSEAMRRLTTETRLSISDFIYPVFVSEVVDKPEPITSMPGIFNYPVAETAREADRAFKLGIPGVILFGTPSNKDATGSASLKKDGIIQRAVSEIKSFNSDILVITDVCLCEYTDHGHCGVVKNNNVIDNDATIDLLARQAVSHAEAGADMVAPSDMMDGRVAAIRDALDKSSSEEVAIMAYAAKYCSAFYGPFREAAGSTPQFGDRASYQMNPANSREALKEIALDVDEGADIVMVKPALSYLDVIANAKAMPDLNVPVAAYNVSGEYSMVKLAAERGIVDERRLALEILTSIKRAGADIIISYHAPDVARWLAD
ncbi:MAG: porphobilinogen synthase [candidate division Zixibacteria bacterium]|nr:porphobilinogen synthase [candidate division Zixibacteria bacterium]